MDRDGRQALRDALGRVERLVHEAHAVEASTKEALAGARDAHHVLARRSIHVQTPDGIVLYALPLTTDDAPLLANLLRAHGLPSASDMDRLVLTNLTVDVPPAVAASRRLVGVRRFFTSKEVQRSGEATAAYIKDFDAWAQREQVDARLQRLRPPTLSGRAESPAAALARVCRHSPGVAPLCRPQGHEGSSPSPASC